MKTKLEMVFDLFLGENEHRPIFHKPFKQNWKVVGTDGMRMIMINEGHCDFEITNTHDVSKLRTFDTECDDYHRYEKVLDISEDIKNSLTDDSNIPVIVECEDCKGDGVVDYEYRSHKDYKRFTEELECPVCEGDGFMEDKEVCLYKLANYDYYLTYSDFKTLITVSENIYVNIEEFIIFMGVKEKHWLLFKVGISYVLLPNFVIEKDIEKYKIINVSEKGENV
jgi:hypothetical protein